MKRLPMMLLAVVVIVLLTVCLLTIAGCADNDAKTAAQTSPQSIEDAAAAPAQADAEAEDMPPVDAREPTNGDSAPGAVKTPEVSAEPAETDEIDNAEDTQALVNDIMDAIDGLDDMFDDDDDLFMDID